MNKTTFLPAFFALIASSIVFLIIEIFFTIEKKISQITKIICIAKLNELSYVFKLIRSIQRQFKVNSIIHQLEYLQLLHETRVWPLK
jgi:hypothetical protein